MLPLISLLLLAFAVCCFAFAAWQPTSPTWNRAVAVGLTFWVFVELLRFAVK
jgi:hypothetical protein